MSARQLEDAPLAEAVDAQGVFSGYASLFNVADMGGDVIQPGAFAQSLGRRGPHGVKMLYQHDPAEPIGQWLTIAEDSRGLRVTGRLMLDLARAREVHALMRAGVLDGLSIGFRTLRGRRDAVTGLRRLFELDLWEISLVTFPMQEAARVAPIAPAGTMGA
ncbi:HK97 family phage prohead protease [Breoghania sp. L-A4]|uniref:HK97 family phage prohead protease n=1 Tax=Breoghania sp. L-A4 TaxID=2304600 RepID=UPI0020BEC175|nr:HK97 family phage prohead protease [Breoghania sp. L-A4]